MTIRVALHHKTQYTYDRPVSLSPHIVRLRPAPHSRTPVVSYSIRVKPGTHFANWQQDPQSNHLLRLVFPEKATVFSVEVDLIAEMTVINPFDFFLETYAETFPFTYETWLERELAPFREKQVAGPLLTEYIARARKLAGSGDMRTIDFLVAVNRTLQEDIKYIIRLEPGVQACEETLTKRSGSCRDSAWLLVQLLRHMGLAARFVSGYLIQLKADEKPLEGPAGTDQDFTDLHAWTEVYLPGAGWVGLDPTSGLLTGEGHIPLAATPEPSSAAPITGAVDKAEVEFGFEMTVKRIHEDPRVTKPYTDKQWQRITELGGSVDEVLTTNDVRLTMGGEPTFVSIDDMDGEEWNTAALGEHKRRLAGDVFVRLRNRFATGALMHYGQGKWYPGEQLPRWALACYWRRDGYPIWMNDALVARDNVDYGADDALAGEFARSLAVRLGVNAEFVQAGHEDTWYYLWKERRLPTNVDPFKSRLEDEAERTRIARVFEQGLTKVVGYALPLSKSNYGWGEDWISGPWFFRPERMYLIPGDSPMGYRLPLDSLPWWAPEDRVYIQEQDPTTISGELASPARMRAGTTSARETVSVGTGNGSSKPLRPQRRLLYGPDPEGRVAMLMEQELEDMPVPPPPGRGESAAWIVRTALCVEPRNGTLHIFMPPTRRLEHYLELLEAIEATAEHFNMPVRIEGYRPPEDHRLHNLKVTPDPGVIEVNIQPSHSWPEQVDITTGLYEEARLARLGTEKFMLDGRHTGTGGGNHIVLGGPSPAESPLLRRPDVLRSLVAYWLNHPGLSYIFAGQFIGPTSQAPRVDEARNDSLYELEIAFSQIPDGAAVPPWLVDRVFRHLLTDLTGNTHRAEFCIDKLYSPDSTSGRLGLLEFRAFEMPPHARMSLTQALLLRALVARFWVQPYRQKLVRWGTQLHDRFMLPHFVWQDFTDVLDELTGFGFPFESDWFLPHLEFRFPVFGRIQSREVEVEVRQAIEPWNVLGEEGHVGGTVRYVDSSVERVQVKVRGMVDPRHALLCNGHEVPLHPTGTNGEYVAGVRFRAWQPPSCLHPMIPVQAPLIFDLFDRWNGRAVGGCTYHVAHPGGRNYTTFPVNAFEAEARRGARFFGYGHSPKGVVAVPAVTNPEFPFTLDLRHVTR